MDNFKKAYDIAIDNLKQNYAKEGLYASLGKFENYWARDSFITSFGAISIKDFEIVKKNLNLFTKFQREDGHISALVETYFQLPKLIGIKIRRKKLLSRHKQQQPFSSETVDSNSWYIISAAYYVKSSKDKKWFLENKENLINAARWLIKQKKENGLINEGYMANWSDCNYRKGYLVYNNILAWKALMDLSKLLSENTSDYFSKEAKKLKKNINEKFWDEDLGYFIGAIDTNGKKYKYFYSDGNLLSIWFDFVDGKKAGRILSYIDRHNLYKYPIPSGHPRLDFFNDYINKVFFPFYRTNFSFTWLGMVLPVVRERAGQEKRALRDLDTLAKQIVRFGSCQEIIDNKGKPMDIIVVKSEDKQAWTAGMYVYVYEMFKEKKLI